MSTSVRPWTYLRVGLIAVAACCVLFVIGWMAYDFSQEMKRQEGMTSAMVKDGDQDADFGFFESAAGSYTAAIELNPRLATAYEGLALSYNALERYGESLAASSKCIKLDSANFDCWVHKGYAAYQLDDCTTAIVALYHASMIASSPKEQDIADSGLGSFMDSEKCVGVSP